ncbi:MAG: response regulator transcription factor [Acidobacteria bacterium]|nr:response regulator transcription factor [Acidobacteriota bacterium]MCA1636903.1 response regulator transcription factor [Acidobacteriota bacterium]
MSEIRVLIAEDHESVREGLRLIVDAQDDMQVCGEAGNGREAVRLAQELAPDVLLMDISMPELNGLTAAAKLKRVAPEIKILTLTRHTDDAYLQELLQAGVSGYVLKQSAASEMLRAIRTVAGGGNYLDPAMTGKVFGNYVGKSTKKPRGETRGAQLSERESVSLRYIALGYSNNEIAEKMDISVKTVEAHKANALRKLNMRSRIDIVRYAILRGWMQDN